MRSRSLTQPLGLSNPCPASGVSDARAGRKVFRFVFLFGPRIGRTGSLLGECRFPEKPYRTRLFPFAT